jgi:uncharacterized coiled-coil DUF342 family protein
MKNNERISRLKTTIQEIKNISENMNNNNIFKAKIDDLNNEISRLKKGISEGVNELEEFLGEEDAGS